MTIVINSVQLSQAYLLRHLEECFDPTYKAIKIKTSLYKMQINNITSAYTNKFIYLQ